MRRAVLAAFAVLLSLPAAPASAAPPTGLSCGFAALYDVASATYEGYAFGGPVVGNGQLSCSIQVGSSTHSGPDAWSSPSPAGTGVVVLTPVPVSFAAGITDQVYTCTSFWDGSTTWYLSAGAWSPSDSACELALRVSSATPVPGSVFDLVEQACTLVQGCAVTGAVTHALVGVPALA